MVLVTKPDGVLRVCIILQQVNLNIVNDTYPINNIEGQL